MLSIYSWMSGLYWKVVSLHRDYTFKTDSVSHQLAIANSSLARTGTSWPPTLSNWNFILLEFAQVLIILSLLVWIPVCNCPDAARKDFLCNSELWLLHFSCLFFFCNDLRVLAGDSMRQMWCLRLHTPVYCFLHLDQFLISVLIATHCKKKTSWWGLTAAIVYGHNDKSCVISLILCSFVGVRVVGSALPMTV